MKRPIVCTCGRKFEKFRDWIVHYNVGVPLVPAWPESAKIAAEKRKRQYREDHMPIVAGKRRWTKNRKVNDPKPLK